MSEVASLEVSAVRIEAVVDHPIEWRSYPGSVIHGVLGQQLKKSSCTVSHGNCRKCYLVHECIYGRLFVSPVPEGAERMRKYPQTPHPLQLAVFPWDKPSLLPGDELHIYLTLMGATGRYLLKTLLALDDCLRVGLGRARNGRRGTARIVSVADRISGERTNWNELQMSYRSAAMTTPLATLVDERASRDIEIRLQTPLRLRTGGRMNFEPQVFDLASNLCRRLENLEYFFGNEERAESYREALDLAASTDAELLIEKAPAIRYSARQKRTVAVSGLIGSVRLRHCPSGLAALFEQGQYTGMGKGATMGLGFFDVID